MNQKVAKLLKKFATAHKLNYRRLKKVYKGFNWIKRTWFLAEIKKGLAKK